MGDLLHTDVSECQAKFKSGMVQAKNDDQTLDVVVGEILYEHLPIHYHCWGDWEDEGHPHAGAVMAKAFSVGNEVVVMFDQDNPVYVVGFKGSPRKCSNIIALYKQIGQSYDWWYWDLEAGEGFHKDPQAPFPAEPLVTRKWYACEQSQVKEYFRETDPAFVGGTPDECGEDCGLLEYFLGKCAGDWGEQQDSGNIFTHHNPCGGPACGDDNWATVTIECEGGGSNQRGVPCARTREHAVYKDGTMYAGYSYDADFINNIEEWFFKNQTVTTSGTHEYDRKTIESSICEPCFSRKWCNCDSPYTCGYGCYAAPGYCSACTVPPNYYYAVEFNCGCIVFINDGCQSIYYNADSGNWGQKFKTASRLSTFTGSWSRLSESEGSCQFTKSRWGYDDGYCGVECDVGTIWDCSGVGYNCSWSEVSYGRDGSVATYKDENHFAMLLTKLTMAASGVQREGGGEEGCSEMPDVSETQISATTEVIFRRHESGSDTDFVLASKQYQETIGSMQCTDRDIGAKPSCSPNNDLPTSFGVRALHWFTQADDQILLVAMEFNNGYIARLYEKAGEAAWTQTNINDFISWVESNSLENHIAFLA